MCLVISKQICEARTPILNSTPADDVTSGAASTAAGARPLLDNFIHRKETIEHNTNQIKLNNN